MRFVKKSAVLVICVCFITGTLLSVVFVSAYSIHEHDQNGPDNSCVYCAYLSEVENLLKHLSVALVGAAIVFGALFAIRFIYISACSYTVFSTLVSLKVRLNN